LEASRRFWPFQFCFAQREWTDIFSRASREKISIHSLCAKENWKGKNDAMPPMVRMVAPSGKQVFEPLHHGLYWLLGISVQKKRF